MVYTVSSTETIQYLNNHIHLTENPSIDSDVEFLVGLVDIIRPKKVKNLTSIDLSNFLNVFHENEAYLNAVKLYIANLFYRKDMDQIFTDAGILRDTHFFYEVKKRLYAKIIPEQSSKNSLQGILNEVFYDRKDYNWIEKIDTSQLLHVFDLFHFNSIYASGPKKFTIEELMYALEILVNRISGRAVETEVIRMVPEFQNFDSPFLSFQREFSEFNEKLLRTDKKYITSDNQHYKQLLILHRQCDNYVVTAFRNSSKFGISLGVNQSLLRIKYQLERIQELLPFLCLDENENERVKSIQFAKLLIKYNCDKNNLKKLIGESTQLLAYEITQHTAKTGEHYITNSKTEYFKMFQSAVVGGFIVAFLCIFKLLISSVDTSAFGLALLQSLNYSLGFVLIYLIGGTLATKQPAMTASALIRELEKDIRNNSNKKFNDHEEYEMFAQFFARVFRSQFAALMGNVLMVFPTALFVVWGIDMLFDINIATQKWYKFAHELHPFESRTVLFSAIAGVFLFSSGLIAGNISNRDKHYNMYLRLQEHPFLKRTFGKKSTTKMAKWYEKRWAGITSNFALGIFLGSIGPVSGFFGLDLDIRHVTFATGNFALAIYGSEFSMAVNLAIWASVGILFVGLFNFLVSFSLSLMLAFRSRNIKMTEIRKVVSSIIRYFKRRPFVFFFPVR